jgi:broad specificity phosphatase PhoE
VVALSARLTRAPHWVSARRSHTASFDGTHLRMPNPEEIVLVRHGATEWSASLKHTGRTDVPLSDEGRAEAHELGDRLGGWDFAHVLCSPLQRAHETAAICGFADRLEIEPGIREWDYGDYEGVTTAEVRKRIPDWTVWTGAITNGETIEDVGARADEVVERISKMDGTVAVFSHGHFLRIFTARWLGLSASDGRLFALKTGTLSVLGYERETRVISRWNL